MKKTDAETALLTPDATGWRLRLSLGQSQSFKTLEEAAVAIPAGQNVHVALPGNLVLIERLQLPAIDREELAGMVQLQLEKTLPYPVEEASSDFEVIRQSESESMVLSVAANTAQLDALCEPLRRQARLPEKITFYAMHVAASCSPEEVVLCIWPEEAQIQVAIIENGRLGFAQNLVAGDSQMLESELPQILLSAEMEGVSTQFSRIRLEQNCESLREPLAALFGTSVELMSLDAPMPEPSGNLAPPAWQAEVRRLAGSVRLRQRLQVVAVAYLLLVAVAFISLAWLKSRVQRLDRQVTALQPEIAQVSSRQSRWRALAPAIDPTRYTIEIMYLVYANLPSDEVHITLFEYGPGNFEVKGEAPSTKLAFDFTAKLQKEPALSDFTILSPPPIVLNQGAASYDITGKL